jgi:hypothetical protein
MISGARSIISARAFINEMVQSEQQQQHSNGNNCMTGTFVLLQCGIKFHQRSQLKSNLSHHNSLLQSENRTWSYNKFTLDHSLQA